MPTNPPKEKLTQAKYAKIALSRFSQNHFSGMTRILWCVIITNFLLWLAVMSVTIFDAPSDSASQIEMVLKCLIFSNGLWLSGNGIYNTQILGGFNFILLGITLFCSIIIYIIFKRLPKLQIRSILSASGVYLVCTIIFFSMSNHDNGGEFFNFALPFILCFTSILMANSEKSFITEFRKLLKTNKYFIKVPKYVILGVRGSFSITAILLILVSVAFIFEQFRVFNTSEEIFRTLNSSPWTAISISLLVLTFLPNLLIFSASILFGGGVTFPLTNGTLFGLPITPTLERLQQFTERDGVSTLIFWGVTIIFLLIFTWQSRKLYDDLLFHAVNRWKIIVSEVCYFMITVCFTILLIFVGFTFLGFVSSGTIGVNQISVGVNSLEFGLATLNSGIIAGIICTIGFFIYKSQKITDESVILKLEALASANSVSANKPRKSFKTFRLPLTDKPKGVSKTKVSTGSTGKPQNESSVLRKKMNKPLKKGRNNNVKSNISEGKPRTFRSDGKKAD